MNGFNFAPITADAIIELCKDFFQNSNSSIRDGQILYLAISEKEGAGKKILEAKHEEVILTLDAPEDMEIYEKFGISVYKQHILLRITQEAREQNALLTIKDLVRLLKSSYSTIKRHIKALRERGFTRI
jgi:DNA-binding transcriptional ArsR family regulator